MDHTHDVSRKSWVDTANQKDTDFPLQNLALGVFSIGSDAPRCGIAIGDQILDLSVAAAQEQISSDFAFLAKADQLDPLFALGAPALKSLRHQAFALLESEALLAPGRRFEPESLLRPMADCTMHLPSSIRSFTDYLSSIYHAERASRAAGMTNPVPPNFKWQPLAYNGRASSVRPSGQPIRRPKGHRGSLGSMTPPTFGPSAWLDFEVEVGFFIGTGNELGEPISIAAAGSQAVGFVLLNDWSSRDLQFWEMAPVGPNISKNFCTTISPWVVTADALEPFRVPIPARGVNDSEIPAYLYDPTDQLTGGLNMELEAFLSTEAMRSAGDSPVRLLTTNARHFYWSFAQMLTAQSVSGCNLMPGDLIGSGTASGPTEAESACLLELTRAGNKPIILPNGEARGFLEDGDDVSIVGRCVRDGYRSIGFGPCCGRVVA